MFIYTSHPVNGAPQRRKQHAMNVVRLAARPFRLRKQILRRAREQAHAMFAVLLASSISMIAAAPFALAQQYEASAVGVLPLGLPLPRASEADSPALVNYGQFLFQTPLLSRDQSIACISCHDPSHALSGPRPVAVGIT